jgi:hypothetical protein
MRDQSRANGDISVKTPDASEKPILVKKSSTEYEWGEQTVSHLQLNSLMEYWVDKERRKGKSIRQ